MHSPPDLCVLTTWLLLTEVSFALVWFHFFGFVLFGFPGKYSDWQLQPRNNLRKFGGEWAQRRKLN